jgi:hypothetical protein
MSPPTDLPTLLRFLTQDAKVPLATALSSVQALQKANLASIESISKAQPEDLQAIFTEPKISKQVINAAKKSSKKRGASNLDDANDNNNNPSSANPPKRPPSSRRHFNYLTAMLGSRIWSMWCFLPIEHRSCWLSLSCC